VKIPKINWPQAAVLVALIGGAVSIVLYAPEELRAPLVALLTGLAGFLRSPTGGEAGGED